MTALLALALLIVLASAALWAVYRFLPLSEENVDPWP